MELLNEEVVEQEFSCRAPGALRVHLAGDFTHWQKHAVPMAKGDGGIWRCKVRLAPGVYRYRFIVDGEWDDGRPECTLRLAPHDAGVGTPREGRSLVHS